LDPLNRRPFQLRESRREQVMQSGAFLPSSARSTLNVLVLLESIKTVHDLHSEESNCWKVTN
jgi:hypothetical protein